MIMQSVVRNKQGSVVGQINNRIFIKQVHGNKHMLRQPMAWAIDADIFDRAIKPNCLSIHIIDRDTGYKYVTGVKTFNEKKKVLDRGHNPQYYLELVHWIVRENNGQIHN